MKLLFSASDLSRDLASLYADGRLTSAQYADYIDLWQQCVAAQQSFDY